MNIRTSPARACGRSASPWASSSLLVGFVVGWSIVAVGAVIALVFALPLGPRHRARVAAWPRSAPRSSRSGAPSRGACAPRRAPAPAPTRPRGRADAAQRLPRAVDARARRRDRRARHGAGARVHGRPGVPQAGPADTRPRPARRLPRGRVRRHDVHLEPEPADVSRRTAFVRNNGFLGKQPSFTILSNHCAHLGCPVQPNGAARDKKTASTRT